MRFYPYVPSSVFTRRSKSILQLLLDQDLLMVLREGRFANMPPLHLAVVNGDLEMLQYLVETLRVGTEICDEDEVTALMLAAQMDQVPHMQVLRELGANMKHRCFQQGSLLQHSVQPERITESFAWLINQSEEDNILEVLEFVTRRHIHRYSDFIFKHLALVDANTMFGSIEDRIRLVSNQNLEFFRACQQGIRLLRNSTVDKIQLSILLTISENSRMARNKAIQAYVGSSAFEDSYPIFHQYFRERFEPAARVQAVLYQGGEKLCQELLGINYQANVVVADKICSFLKMEDMENLAGL
ncbi:hypothetical protein QAD02_008415 [Eretmocerus hayati]|uniref:Uncharacterized protein n=1 Tax=Eretmocerus hayati TaxID=131215 RepID=A0ACC2N7R1_9HYME|nr:hypothetical protein QAD02_008415 [Eretmocerus hayati]